MAADRSSSLFERVMSGGALCPLRVSRHGWLYLLFVSLAACWPLRAQTPTSATDSATKPYATLDRQSVKYLGPIRATENESPGDTAVIGMILPLRGSQEAEGKALLAAAQIAVEEEQAQGTLPGGRRLVLAVRDESGPWGQASSEILKLVEQDHALVVLTSANGSTAHQAEQIANKISFPILTLASDPTTTQTNVPWVFRLGPSDADQARAFCDRIASQQRQKILLIDDTDRDGRIGGAEFEKITREMKMPAPERLEIAPSALHLESILERIREREPDAIVVWTDAGLARQLLPIVRVAAPSALVFLCSKAALLDAVLSNSRAAITDKGNSVEFLTAASLNDPDEAGPQKFAPVFRERVDAAPGNAAFEVYKAVHLVALGIRTVGANRELLREYFAGTDQVRRNTVMLSFDPAGNSTREFELVKIAGAGPTLTRP